MRRGLRKEPNHGRRGLMWPRNRDQPMAFMFLMAPLLPGGCVHHHKYLVRYHIIHVGVRHVCLSVTAKCGRLLRHTWLVQVSFGALVVAGERSTE